MRRRRFFDDLLIATLHRAIALTQRNHVAATIAEDLHFDVAGALDELLEEDAALTEIALRQALDGVKASPVPGRVRHNCMPMPPPPAVLFSITG